MVHDQSLVIWKNDFSRTRQTAGFLARGVSPIAFPVSQWPRPQRRMSFSAYSDEIAQAFDLFPFYPLPPMAAKAPTAVFNFTVLYPFPFIAVKRMGL